MKIIILKNGETTTVDDEDYLKCSHLPWRLTTKGYASYSPDSGKSYVSLHNFILDLPSSSGVDHKDRNKLNNCKDNLRIATNTQQGANRGKFKNNTTGFRGVSMKTHSKGLNYYVSIKVNYKAKCLGYFATAEEAAKVYDENAIKYFGEFASLNFPTSKEINQ